MTFNNNNYKNLYTNYMFYNKLKTNKLVGSNSKMFLKL